MNISTFRINIAAIIVYVFCFVYPAFSQQVPEFTIDKIICDNGSKPGQLNRPESISIDLSGNIYIADTGNNRIQKFSPAGKLLKHYGGFGSGNEQFDRPVSICAETGLEVFVADMNNHRILRFDRQLNFISVFSADAVNSDIYRFQFPKALAVSSANEIFLVDGENNRIVHFDAFNEPRNQFGGYDSPGEPLNDPSGIFVLGTDRVFVTDRGKNEIIVYDYFGNYLETISHDELKEPSGICVDKYDNIFVCVPGSFAVLVFNKDGECITKVLHPLFSEPIDVACNDSGLYVLDGERSSVFIFKIEYK